MKAIPQKYLVLFFSLVVFIFTSAALVVPLKQKDVKTLIANVTPEPSPSSVPSLIPSPSPTPEVQSAIPSSPEVRRWMIAAGGVLAVQNDEGLEELRTKGSDDLLYFLLSSSWDIDDRETALQQLKWLKRSGHSKQFEKMRKYVVAATNGEPEKFTQLRSALMDELLMPPQDQVFLIDFIWKHKDLAGKEVIAWDYMRIINVARWSYTLGYITEEEAWENITFAATRLQKTFSSWEEMGDNYIIGRAFWKHSTENADAEQAIRWLETNSKSPWRTLAWDLNLQQ